MTAYRYQTKKGIRWEYLCNYVDYDGSKRQRHKQGFLTKKEALEAEREFLTSRKFDDKTTFGTAVELFKQKKYPTLKKYTKRGYNSAINHLRPFFDVPLQDLDEDEVEKYISALDKADLTKVRVATLFCSVYAYGAKVCKLPRTTVKVKVKSYPREYKIYTLEEYERFRSHLEGASLVYFDLLYYTGLRKGEALALDATDVTDMISVTKTKDDASQITPPKTPSSVRKVAIPKFLQEELNEYISKLPDPEGPLFPVGYNYFNRVHVQAEKAAGLHHIRQHDFRHSHASFLISKGVNIADISKRLGHANISTTLTVYAHLYKDREKEIAEILEKSVKKP